MKRKFDGNQSGSAQKLLRFEKYDGSDVTEWFSWRDKILSAMRDKNLYDYFHRKVKIESTHELESMHPTKENTARILLDKEFTQKEKQAHDSTRARIRNEKDEKFLYIWAGQEVPDPWTRPSPQEIEELIEQCNQEYLEKFKPRTTDTFEELVNKFRLPETAVDRIEQEYLTKLSHYRSALDSSQQIPKNACDLLHKYLTDTALQPAFEELNAQDYPAAWTKIDEYHMNNGMEQFQLIDKKIQNLRLGENRTIIDLSLKLTRLWKAKAHVCFENKYGRYSMTEQKREYSSAEVQNIVEANSWDKSDQEIEALEYPILVPERDRAQQLIAILNHETRFHNVLSVLRVMNHEYNMKMILEAISKQDNSDRMQDPPKQKSTGSSQQNQLSLSNKKHQDLRANATTTLTCKIHPNSKNHTTNECKANPRNWSPKEDKKNCVYCRSHHKSDQFKHFTSECPHIKKSGAVNKTTAPSGKKCGTRESMDEALNKNLLQRLSKQEKLLKALMAKQDGTESGADEE